jgi:hypothetical protein
MALVCVFFRARIADETRKILIAARNVWNESYTEE